MTPPYFPEIKKDKSFLLKAMHQIPDTLDNNRSILRYLTGHLQKIGGNRVYEILEKEKSHIQRIRSENGFGLCNSISGNKEDEAMHSKF